MSVKKIINGLTNFEIIKIINHRTKTKLRQQTSKQSESRQKNGKVTMRSESKDINLIGTLKELLMPTSENPILNKDDILVRIRMVSKKSS